MADLADEALDLLSTAGSRWHTLRASGREWRHTALASQAWHAQIERRRAEGQSFSSIRSESKVPRPEETDEEWHLLISGAWRRATFVAGRQNVDVVFHEATWWSNGHGVSRTNAGALNFGHGEGPGEHLVSTGDYPPLIEIRDISAGSWLGRETLDAKVGIRGVLPRRRGRGLHGLVIGDADEIILAIERERGVILRAASWYGGSVYRIIEMKEVAFDEQPPPDAFVIRPLPGPEWEATQPG